LFSGSKARWLSAGVGVFTALAAGVVFMSYPGCNVYDSSLLLPGDGSASSGSSADGCSHAVWPDRPGNEDNDGGGSLQVTAAFTTIDIGLGSGPDAGIPPFGYDLDGVCTCPGPPSCAQMKGAYESCDDDAGRDHTAISLFNLLGAPASAGTQQIDEGLSSGQYSLLLVINGYNGQPDDSHVVVDFYVSNGINRDPDGGIPTPKFDGHDHWTIDPTLSLSGGQVGGAPIFEDDSAYVSKGQVVAHMPGQLPIVFGDRSFLGGARMLLSESIIVGTLSLFAVGDDAGNAYAYQLTSGTIAGRWPTASLLTTLASIPDSTRDGGYLCGPDSFAYNLIKAAVCQAADISQTIGNDNQTPLAPCDAVSVGLQFTAKPAQLGDSLSLPPAPAGCQVNGVPFTDHCSN
jgi:hypothetical protein